MSFSNDKHSGRRQHLLYVLSVLAALLLLSSIYTFAWRDKSLSLAGTFQATASLRTGSAAWGFDYSSAYKQVYRPHGYAACPAPNGTSSCWLALVMKVDCDALFDDYIRTLVNYVPAFPPPKALPPSMRDEFLLRDLTFLSSLYFAQEDHAPAVTVEWTQDTIKDSMQQAAAHLPVGPYGDSSIPLYQAIRCHPITGARGAVFGSETPWLEGVLFASGAAHITTIEFRTTVSHIANHKVIKPLQWAQEVRSGSLPHVDFAFAFSSWEHDGLGRYGDPVKPWGDIEAVQRASCYVKTGSAHNPEILVAGGLLFFAGPSSGLDQLQYNAHRIYGPVRLPLLTANWAVLGVYDAKFRTDQCGSATCDGLFRRWHDDVPLGDSSFQPVIVLRNMRTSPCSNVVPGGLAKLH